MKVPEKRECLTCGHQIKPDERAFRIEGTPYWKCDRCQFNQDAAMTEREKRSGQGLGRIEKAALKAKLRAEKCNPI